MGGRKGVFSTPAGEGGAGEHPLASDALEVSADSWGPVSAFWLRFSLGSVLVWEPFSTFRLQSSVVFRTSPRTFDFQL